MSAGRERDPIVVARMRGMALRELKRYGDSIPFLAQVFAARPKDSEAGAMCADSMRMVGQCQEALELLARVIAQRPHDEIGHRILSATYDKLGREEEAYHAAKESVRCDPHGVWPLRRLAKVAAATRRSGEAREAAAAATRIAPDDPLVWEALAAAEEASWCSRGAAAAYRNCVRLRPNDDDYHRSVGFSTDGEESIEAHRRAIVLRPGARNFWSLASRLVDLGREEEALSLLDDTLLAREDRYNYITPTQLLARLAKRHAERAWEIMAPVLNGSGGHPPFKKPLLCEAAAVVLEKLGRTDEAATWTGEALRGYPTLLDAEMSLTDWCIGAYDYDRAMQNAIALRALEVPPARQDDIEKSWFTAYRVSGRAGELASWVRAEIAAGTLRKPLSQELYWAYRSTEPDLARWGAEVAAREAAGLDWPARVCELDEDIAGLAALEERATRARDLVMIARMYTSLDQFEDAERLLRRALLRAPFDDGALSAAAHLAFVRGDLARAARWTEIHERLYPSKHYGSEAISLIAARRGDVDTALAQSERALDRAPYCEGAIGMRGIAFAIAGRYDEARPYIALSERHSVPADRDEIALVSAALRGDRPTLEMKIAAFRAPQRVQDRGFEDRVREIAVRCSAR